MTGMTLPHEDIDPHPSPSYLLGSMIEDAVPRDLAVTIAKGYAEARKALSDELTHRWLNEMSVQLHAAGHCGPNTMLAVLCRPSEHAADHYDDLAASAGWKEA